jgi:hypothetical protein
VAVFPMYVVRFKISFLYKRMFRCNRSANLMLKVRNDKGRA